MTLNRVSKIEAVRGDELEKRLEYRATASKVQTTTLAVSPTS